MNEKITKARKNNIKLHPIYQMIGLDLLFFYGIKILFLSQVRGISDTDIVFSTSAYAFFSIFWQIIATVIVARIGKRKCVFIGNLLNCLYVVLVMTSTDLIHLIIAEFISAIAFSLKGVSESPILNSSIPKTSKKGEIFSRIDAKGYSKYCYASALSTIIAGYIYNVNPYFPMIVSLIVSILGTMISFNFIDMEEVEEQQENDKQITLKDCIGEIKQGFQFIFQSGRLKALLLMFGTIWGLLCLFSNYQTTLLKNMNLSAEYIGIVLASLELIKGLSCNKTNQFHEKHRNHSLSIIALNITIGAMIAGISAILNIPFSMQIIIILITYFLRYIYYGIFQIIKKRYMGNFANKTILPKIYSAEGVISNLLRMIIGFIGTAILGAMNIQYAMISAGVIFTIFVFGIIIYMKSRVGLKPEQYSEKDVISKVEITN